MNEAIQRINVIGTTGSGKSTVSNQIAEKLNLPYIELEALCWQSNWTELTDEKFFSKVEKALSTDSWVLDGTYPRTRHIKWNRVQIVIYLDLPFHIVLYRIIKRSLIRGFKNEELWAGNKETVLKHLFTRDSMILWTMKTFFTNRKRFAINSKNPEYSHIKFVRLRSKKEIGNFVTQLKN